MAAKRRLTRHIDMATLAARMGMPIRTARRMLLRAQTRAGQPIMFKTGDPVRAKWYTTEALLVRFAPELVDAEPEAIDAARELRAVVTARLKDLATRLDSLEAETRRSFRAVRREFDALSRDRA